MARFRWYVKFYQNIEPKNIDLELVRSVSYHLFVFCTYLLILCTDPRAPSGGVTVQSVFRLMSDATVSVLLMDVRSRDDFTMSHIKSIDCINVPAECLKPGWVSPHISTYFVLFISNSRSLLMSLILLSFKTYTEMSSQQVATVQLGCIFLSLCWASIDFPSKHKWNK